MCGRNEALQGLQLGLATPTPGRDGVDWCALQGTEDNTMFSRVARLDFQTHGFTDK